ncbi:hypothetical protein GJ699_18600 [Duganella sp. FT80W]|uniref:DUF6036 domain-containing protein n=1 Tax=Duganella guangzhouensis TaxID=2666084 RepID=A0A6I2L4B7_9BURK|nr:DUF6036 family nucleotidyltransferase [Duganella guangzhouensis]MRW92007.1 hypothetical protein [Duganella guangzhouensis]
MGNRKTLGQTVLDLFGNLGNLLAEANLPEGTVRAYLFGGCAVHMYVNSRLSVDIDAEFDYNLIHREDVLLALSRLRPIDFEHPGLGPFLLDLDPRFTTTLCPLHVDYQDRAVQLELGQRNTVPLTVWLPSPLDLAISKLGRFSTVDIDDILLLLKQPGACWAEFERLAMESSQYYVGPDLAGAIAHLKWRYQERGDDDFGD